MKVKWKFNCGYVLNIPAFTIEIPDEDVADMPEVERDKVIDEYVRTEFENQVTYDWEIVE